MISTPSLVNTLFENSALSFDSIRWSLLTNFFGADRRREKQYSEAHNDASACFQHEPLGNSRASQTTLGVALKGRIQEYIPNLVSFNESVVDQNEWERAANPRLKPKYGHTSPSVEVSLFTLLRNFTGHVALPTLVGTEFLEAHPSTLDDLWDLDGGFKYLVLGLPRLLGIPSLTRAHIARRRLLNAIYEFHEALDRTAAGDELEQPWRDLGDVSSAITGRSSIWRRYGTPRTVKGPCDLSLLWA